MRVAESMVIFRPIDQVGCASAIAGVTVARSISGLPWKGPPEQVSHSLAFS